MCNSLSTSVSSLLKKPFMSTSYVFQNTKPLSQIESTFLLTDSHLMLLAKKNLLY